MRPVNKSRPQAPVVQCATRAQLTDLPDLVERWFSCRQSAAWRRCGWLIFCYAPSMRARLGRCTAKSRWPPPSTLAEARDDLVGQRTRADLLGIVLVAHRPDPRLAAEHRKFAAARDAVLDVEARSTEFCD